ncbi:hypothetical protein PDJ96_26930 [Bacillus cereus group sp. BY17LC]|nr:hypothetical protein [Bacillus cereus group sp. BY17LC]MDA1840316.1 hypothetical protein [Bacillus cereus group sp. BY17LC]
MPWPGEHHGPPVATARSACAAPEVAAQGRWREPGPTGTAAGRVPVACGGDRA